MQQVRVKAEAFDVSRIGERGPRRPGLACQAGFECFRERCPRRGVADRHKEQLGVGHAAGGKQLHQVRQLLLREQMRDVTQAVVAAIGTIGQAIGRANDVNGAVSATVGQQTDVMGEIRANARNASTSGAKGTPSAPSSTH